MLCSLDGDDADGGLMVTKEDLGVDELIKHRAQERIRSTMTGFPGFRHILCRRTYLSSLLLVESNDTAVKTGNLRLGGC